MILSFVKTANAGRMIIAERPGRIVTNPGRMVKWMPSAETERVTRIVPGPKLKMDTARPRMRMLRKMKERMVPAGMVAATSLRPNRLALKSPPSRPAGPYHTLFGGDMLLRRILTLCPLIQNLTRKGIRRGRQLRTKRVGAFAAVMPSLRNIADVGRSRGVNAISLDGLRDPWQVTIPSTTNPFRGRYALWL